MTSEILLHLMQNLCIHNVIIHSNFHQISKNHKTLKQNFKKRPSLTFEVKLYNTNGSNFYQN